MACLFLCYLAQNVEHVSLSTTNASYSFVPAVIFNGQELYNVMVERCGPSKTSGPK